MKREYKGTIIEESLEDNRVLNKLDIRKLRVTKERNPADRWHLFSVFVTKKEIIKFSKKIKQGWYMHFWKRREVIVIFKNKRFEFDYDNKESWKPAIEYGISLGIPKKQLDFPIDRTNY
ncbi:hypothetical protein COU61_01120 [Candidatus Pacearchaeota archaeon CG10_big_fil_rev_8_21_14_0_10_35_13]|nr:MAG: hypothetical protein COU61_01120 [Candidatus Pacearchaeota archaeon CG10_big_fil_rev_8_21_14_0_10_35_13]